MSWDPIQQLGCFQIIANKNKAFASHDGGEMRETNCTAATTVLHPVSCNEQIHHTDPLPPIIMENKNKSN